jgi:hypothetical protein
MAKAEISWKSCTPDGERRQVYVHHVGNQWRFFAREKRFDCWQPVSDPPLEDWLELLDAVRRRVARRLIRPEEEPRLRLRIRELFPDADVP